jgi:hypothetical protein
MRLNPQMILAVVAILLLTGCCNSNYGDTREYVITPSYAEDYQPAKGRVFHVASFDVAEGDEMKDVFDEFEEPMHAPYYSHDTVKWTYYVDYDAENDEGRIVRYCELKDYPPRSLCKMTVEFYRTYVTNAYSTCS